MGVMDKVWGTDGILTTTSEFGLKLNEELPQRVLSASCEEILGFWAH